MFLSCTEIINKRDRVDDIEDDSPLRRGEPGKHDS
jgi:geranylgeranyl pyrophosphate synthase